MKNVFHLPRPEALSLLSTPEQLFGDSWTELTAFNWLLLLILSQSRLEGDGKTPWSGEFIELYEAKRWRG